MAINYVDSIGTTASRVFPRPVIAQRDPSSAAGTKDFNYPVGQEWVNELAGNVWFLSQFNLGLPVWLQLTAGGGTGVFTSLTVTGPSTLTGTTHINTTGSAVTSIGTGGTGAVNIGNATGNTAITGSLTASTSITATLGNITATNGNIILGTATNHIQLPGPVNIMSGAGVPASGLALHVGDIYTNTTAASATTRLYIATAAGTWTNVTCAA